MADRAETPGNGGYVTWGRYDAEMHALVQRIEALEHAMEQRWQEQAQVRTEHQTRVWQAALAIVTGQVLPLLVLGTLAVIHLATRS